MRIAVCFFGITRNLRQHTLASIEGCLLAPVARLDPGYQKFGHFNLVTEVVNPRAGESGVAVEPNDFEALRCDVTSTTPQPQVDRELDLTSIEAFGDVWEDNFSSVKNLLRQLYSLERVTDLLNQSGTVFDMVIYSRADLRFEGEVRLPRVRPRTLYTPWFSKGGGLNDRFGLGDMPTMTLYGGRRGLARLYCEETGQPLHAERLLAWCARRHQLRTVDLTTICFSRVRANGTVPDWDRKVHKELKHRLKRAGSILKNFVRGD